MIKISSETKSSGFNGCIRHFVICPQCLQEDWFFNFAMKACPGCGFVWGDVHKLMDDINIRKLFHINGEI